MTLWKTAQKKHVQMRLRSICYQGQSIPVTHAPHVKKPILEQGHLLVDLTDAERLLTHYLRVQTLHHTTQTCARWADIMDLAMPIVKVRRYKRRIGCCHPTRNTLTFHERLISAPLAIIDYVIIHELTHLNHPNHSKAFWGAVKRFDPNYRAHHDWLKVHGGALYAPLYQNPSLTTYPKAFATSLLNTGPNHVCTS